MTAPVPPGHVQAPPLTAAEAERVARFDAAPDLGLATEVRQETVARAIFAAKIDGEVTAMDWRAGLDDEDRAGFRRLAAAAVAADDAWRAEHAGEVRGCSCPMSLDTGARGLDYKCPIHGYKPAPEPAAALAPADHEPADAIQRVLALADRLDEDWEAVMVGHDHDECLGDIIRAAVSAVQPAATEPQP
jgi:hypothetical protein